MLELHAHHGLIKSWCTNKHVSDEAQCLFLLYFCCLQDPFVFESNCFFKVDAFGFFLTWKSDGKVAIERM